jgi:hypothetical protein
MTNMKNDLVQYQEGYLISKLEKQARRLNEETQRYLKYLQMLKDFRKLHGLTDDYADIEIHTLRMKLQKGEQ